MNVLIHGAAYTSNFGDILFAHLFYDKCRELNNCEVDFLQFPRYGICDFCRKELHYEHHISVFSSLKSDVLILMSGGYFGENKGSFINSIRRYLAYFFPTRIFQFFGKPVYVLGVGGGPLSTPFLRKSAVRLLNKAKVITVRDKETKDYFVKYGVKNHIEITSDTAQVIRSEMIPDYVNEQELVRAVGNHKLLFFHIIISGSNDEKYATSVVPGIIKFLNAHPEYQLVVGTDEIRSIDSIINSKCYQKLSDKVRYIHEYRDCWQMVALLKRMDFVVTPKLHVGIVSATLGKSVISFPIHLEKTQRYYRQIGEAERSVHIDSVTTDIAYSLLERYHNIPIALNSEIRNAAKRNLDIINQISQYS